ncbi:MAG: cytidylate kinase-like family protein [Candidatus Omnitrophica bacterium]|nr:cytidylate kinase-like family protein [Candidatus Omnitrophota bacterium]
MAATTRLLDICKAYLDCQIRCAEDAKRKNHKRTPHPFVTISRQTGAGGITISGKLVEFLRENDQEATCPWTVFDKDLVEHALNMHQLPQTLKKYMTEEKISEMQGFFEELFGLHPSEWTLVHKVSETIYHLAEMGCSILVGRGAHMITRNLPYGVHARLIGSLEKRIAHIQDYYHLDRTQAIQLIHKEDHGRADYLKKHFGQNVDDPFLYDVVINTDFISYDETARMIGEQVLRIRSRF